MKEIRDGESTATARSHLVGSEKLHHRHHHHHLPSGGHLVTTSVPSPPFVSNLSLLNTSAALSVFRTDPTGMLSAHLLASFAATNPGARFQLPLPLALGVPVSPASPQLYHHHHHHHHRNSGLNTMSSGVSPGLPTGNPVDLLSRCWVNEKVTTGNITNNNNNNNSNDKNNSNNNMNLKAAQNRNNNNNNNESDNGCIIGGNNNGGSWPLVSEGVTKNGGKKNGRVSKNMNGNDLVIKEPSPNLLKDKKGKRDILGKNANLKIEHNGNGNYENNNNNNNSISSIGESNGKRERLSEEGDDLLNYNNNKNRNIHGMGQSNVHHSGTQGQQQQQSRDKVFICSICNRCFGYKHVLQNHERTHTGEKPFSCNICHKKFTRDHHLKTHMRLHTGEKPYQCSHCERQFVQVANLRRHLRVHTGERPYACNICSSRFSDSNQLKAHNLIHKGEKPFSCSECGGRFRRRHHLAHHKCSSLKTSLESFETVSPSKEDDDEDDDVEEEEEAISPPVSNIKQRERKSRETRRVIRIAGLPLVTTKGTNHIGPYLEHRRHPHQILGPEQTVPEDLSLGSGGGSIRSRHYSGSHTSCSTSASPSPPSGGSGGSLGSDLGLRHF